MKTTSVILLHFAIAIVVGLIATLFGGKNSGLSSIFAGLSCVVPNAIFLVGLHVSEHRKSGFGLFIFFFSELTKIVLTIVLVIVVFWRYQNVNWLSFIVSFIIVMKSYVFLLSKSKN